MVKRYHLSKNGRKIINININEFDNEDTNIYNLLNLGIPLSHNSISNSDEIKFNAINIKGGTKDPVYSGSGILLFDILYNNQQGRSEPVVILFKSNFNLLYQGLGGYIDKTDHDSKYYLGKTAQRETREESMNYIRIPVIDKLSKKVNNKNLFVDVKNTTSDHLYRCHIVTITSNILRLHEFQLNRHIVELGSHVPKEWKEVDRMSRFFVSDILNSISENRTSCHDTNGVNRRIRGRTWNCLEKILDGWNKDESNSLLSVAMKYPYNVHKVKDKGEKYSFLKNTISLILT
jgi:hypothetical protein